MEGGKGTGRTGESRGHGKGSGVGWRIAWAGPETQRRGPRHSVLYIYISTHTCPARDLKAAASRSAIPEVDRARGRSPALRSIAADVTRHVTCGKEGVKE